MSRETLNDPLTRVGRVVTDSLARTAFAIRVALSRRDGRVSFGAATLVYFSLYEYGLGHLGAHGGGVRVFVVADPLTRAFQRLGPYQYEPVAAVAAGPVEYLFSPVTAGIGLVLAVLVGVNLAVSWIVWRRPTACRVNPGVGAVAGVPALLSGFACCGPTILLVVGLQASAGIVALFQWLIPLGFVLLLASLLWVGRNVQPGTGGAAA